MFIAGSVSNSFYFIRDDEKRVAELYFVDDCFRLVNERAVEGYVNAEFMPLEKALMKLVKAEQAKELDVIMEATKQDIDSSNDVLETLRKVAIQNLPTYSLFLNEAGNYRVQRSTPLKLLDLTAVNSRIDFAPVVTAVTDYDNGTISGKTLQERVKSWYDNNGFAIDLTGKRVYNLKHCISISLNVKKRKISSTVKTAMIAFVAICPESAF